MGKDFMLKASEWICYYNYDRSHDGLGGKSPGEALTEVNPKLPEGILFLPPIILDDRITLLGGGTEVYRHYRGEDGERETVYLPLSLARFSAFARENPLVLRLPLLMPGAVTRLRKRATAPL